MPHSLAPWTTELLERRRALHSRIDVLARTDPAGAARSRLTLYTVVHRFSEGHDDAEVFDAELGLLEDVLSGVPLGGAPVSGLRGRLAG